MLEIKGENAVITDGTGGIGIALVQKWLELGGRAVIADIDENSLQTANNVLRLHFTLLIDTLPVPAPPTAQDKVGVVG